MKLETIKTILGKPFYENEFGLIYKMDCSEGLKKIKKSSINFDATITSPPYNIGKEYEEILGLEDYIDWIVSVNDLVYDTTKPDGAYLLNLGYFEVTNKGRAVPIPYLLWDKSKFYLNQEIIWNYGAGVAAKQYLSPRNEKVLWYVKNPKEYTFNLDAIRDPDIKYPNQKKNGKLRCNTLGKNPSDVWQIAKVTSGKSRSSKERMPHPAQFPEDLIKRMVLGFSNEGDLILDPFIGSGTTARTAMIHNRKFIGFEINDDYCNTLESRLETTMQEIEQQRRILQLF